MAEGSVSRSREKSQPGSGGKLVCGEEVFEGGGWEIPGSTEQMT